MNILCKDVQNIIIEYKQSLEHYEKMSDSLVIIRNMTVGCSLKWSNGIGMDWVDYDEENDEVLKTYKEIHLCNRCFNLKMDPYNPRSPDFCTCGVLRDVAPEGWMERKYSY